MRKTSNDEWREGISESVGYQQVFEMMEVRGEDGYDEL